MSTKLYEFARNKIIILMKIKLLLKIQNRNERNVQWKNLFFESNLIIRYISSQNTCFLQEHFFLLFSKKLYKNLIILLR